MFLFSIVFLLGDLYLQTFADLPSISLLLAVSIISIFLWWQLRSSYRCSHLLVAFCLGCFYSAWYAKNLLATTLPKKCETKPVIITGTVLSLPNQQLQQTNFLFSSDELCQNRDCMLFKTTVKLAWRENSNHLRVGDKWQLLVRLKRIHGMQNPGTFDYEAWALQKGIRAAGYVINHQTKNLFLNHTWFIAPIDQLRQLLAERLHSILPNTKTAPWLLALMIGERHNIDAASWEILRKTGTNHIMAVAGLHIGMMAGFAHWLMFKIWKCLPKLALSLPAQFAGAYAALSIAFIYSALAGFSIPTQRACIMLSIFIFTLLLRRKTNPWQVWAFAMLMVLLINPLTVLTESFWLSFGTIALIIYSMHGRLAPTGMWWKWGRVQWVIGFGLIPVTLLFFQESSFISFFANVIAVPWLGFLILPFCLSSAAIVLLAPKFAALLLWFADKNLSYLWMILTWLANLPFVTWHHAVNHTGILFITLGAFIILLLPIGFPGRYVGLFWLLPICFYQTPRPKTGEFWLTLLDVGQGLSVVVKTKNHTLVYDTGANAMNGWDMGKQVLVPYLQFLNIQKIDRLVISHGDNDHRGGAKALLQALPVADIKTSVPEKLLPWHASVCLTDFVWQWDEVKFSFLYPTTDYLGLGNNSSCVLRIDNGKHSVLLTGDIEKFAEKFLLTRFAARLAAAVLVAPHHGSKTSGLPKFIAAVHPQLVLYPIGYRNRYHFPHPSIISAYHKIGALQLNTAQAGMIQVQFNQKINVTNYRQEHKRYWYTDN